MAWTWAKWITSAAEAVSPGGVHVTIRPKTLLWRLALALVLVAGQLAAQAHAYSHLRFTPELSDHGGVGTAFCNDCLAFAPLLSPGGATHPPALPAAVQAALLFTAPDDGLSAVRLALGFRSRAPPALS